MTADKFGKICGIAALVLLAVGLATGMLVAPRERIMGDVYRIMFVHFPSWVGTAAGYLTAFVASIAYIKTRDFKWDYWGQAGAEVGLLFNVTGLITGALWGRPTWGVYWTWDPRLTTTAIMAITFAGYLVLRAFMEDPESRARAASLVAIVGFVNVPIVYFSVRWWRTLHQVQSSPETVDPQMVWPLRAMMLAFLLLGVFMMTRRVMLARLRGEEEMEMVRLEVARD
ncbi:MAG: transcriptional regulator [Gemmatimonadetes bacterium]|uniref:Heme exporter protein C n=1 Tax=Candidatus Kutchimonas denitrificans TaxID=3056748 RepID=A0AAE4ZAN1_9BACT|nr:transcriptional regulator [Gemmatimonadota bacterium]NIR76153.1 transcriptional regulator [Candidatus Kutchimonas denitrificans]NIS00532.1 transcriptional regulator [Gemmatimonadota bacterium]NIT66190.1 transcriptional regulator [Gemmatimonadota bacterium]NIU54268.1 transcriptional regulator [Gemmatimonadota bacterium]